MKKYYYFMQKALKEAKKAKEHDEIPVGAIIVFNNRIIDSTYNLNKTLKNPIAHAEIQAIKKASQILNSYRLINTELYVTLEPCPMCAGAIVYSRIKKLIIGASDPKTGACGSVVNILEKDKFNHNVELVKGILSEECSELLKDFFKHKRKKD